VTDDSDLADRLRALRSHGVAAPGTYTSIGGNSRLDAIQAAVLRVKLQYLDTWTNERIALADAYDSAFGSRGALASSAALGDSKLGLLTPERPAAPERHVFHRYVVRVGADRRDDLIAHLSACGIGSEVFYHLPLHRQPNLAEFAPASGLPESEAAARETLALPLYPGLRTEQIERVAFEVSDFLSR